MKTAHLVDPELRPLLDLMPERVLAASVLPAMREQRQTAALESLLQDDGLPVTVSQHHISGGENAPAVRVVVISPQHERKGRMGILHIHGGGYVLGSPEQSMPLTRPTTAQHECVIVSVDYRLAPETPFPGPLEDCYAALIWMTAQAEALGIDPAHIGVMGDSAGAGLAASLALLTRDRGGPTLAFQNLMYPMLDDRTVTDPNPNPVTGEFSWTREDNRFGWHAYLGHEAGLPDISCYAAAARAEDLSGLPPAWIGVGSIDLFLDENIDYARRLIRAGVPVEFSIYPGGFHGFNGDPAYALARRARKQRQDALAGFNPLRHYHDFGL
ncbi:MULTISPECIES: alpha/beta hydrolase [Rahnella]|uniref:Alpha/beta hydrolase n=1 Tax=Rahnella sp. (strain Y9602) TaxID=2703885 RepID=A0ABW6CAJ6_RAHSY|nr:alpha/beta hydrolase [uncultured Rahnella sp.]MDP9705785.1 acetyl esterase/lipase [Rahnella aquatilis]